MAVLIKFKVLLIMSKKLLKKERRWFKLNKNKMLKGGLIVFGQYLDPIYPPLALLSSCYGLDHAFKSVLSMKLR